jgi:hypothetical protein
MTFLAGCYHYPVNTRIRAGEGCGYLPGHKFIGIELTIIGRFGGYGFDFGGYLLLIGLLRVGALGEDQDKGNKGQAD